MEYANIHTQHHHQLQEQNNLGVLQSAASLPITTAGNCNWNPRQLILNNGTDVYPTETIPNSRLWQHSPITTSTFTSDHQDFNYGDDHHDHARSSAVKPTANKSPLPNIKEESNSPSYTAPDDNDLYSNNYLAQNYSTISLNASFGYVFNPGTITNSSTSTTSRSTSSMLFPSLVLSSGGFNNSLEALDLLSPTAYNNSTHDRSTQSYSSPSSQHSNNSIGGLYRDQPMSQYGHHDMQESRSSNMTSAFFNEVARSKRPSSFSEPKESHAEANKKSKSILRSSNPPLKVRKEKLGDRIAALHRLVSPFGKTDTASVLTEAIGYIQFLHDQVQTLSMPYLKSLQSKPTIKLQQVHGMRKEEETELKMDLRSRGLCLVPQSCASYLNGFD